MKNSKILFFSLGMLFYGTTQILAQEPSLEVDKRDVKVQKHTMMEQFEPDLVVSANQRMAMKNQRAADINHKRAILDTLHISDRKKRRLLRDLKNSPFSERLDKAFIVNTEFQDATENNDL